MRHTGALSKLKSLPLALAALLLGACRIPAHAQITFDGLDYNLDRGAFRFTVTTLNGAALRLGYNNFPITVLDTQHNGGVLPLQDSPGNNNPGYGVQRFVWPATQDLAAGGATYIVDNPNANFDFATYPGGKSNPNYSGGQQPTDAISVWGNSNNNPWIIPPPANRPYQTGFSFGTDSSLAYNYDYGYVYANTQNINYIGDNGAVTTAQVGDLIPLPYVHHTIYQAVHNTLTDPNNPRTQPLARWSLGTYNTVISGYDTTKNPPTPIYTKYPIPTGDYRIRIKSPGSGTLIDDGTGNLLVHPNVFHVWVQVSYYKTVDPATGNFNFGTLQNNLNRPWTPTDPNLWKPGAGGLNDPVYSRFFLVDLTTNDWHDLEANATTNTGTPAAPAVFHYTAPTDYDPQNNGAQIVPNQIVVTLYPATPDDITDTNLFLNAPLITADAVEFIQTGSNGLDLKYNASGQPNLAGELATPADAAAIQAALNLGPIQSSGRILSPIVSTNKIRNAANANDPVNNGHPLFFVAREETYAATQIDPSNTGVIKTIDPTVNDLTLSTDPDHTFTRPVFYCLGDDDEQLPLNPALPTANLIVQPSYRRIRWRYVGMPDTGGGTAYASPLIANVRCRDGVVRQMVYFVTTSQDGTLGHIYAFDPLGMNPDGTLPYAAGDRGITFPNLPNYNNFINPQAGDDGISAAGVPVIPPLTDANGNKLDNYILSALLLPSRTTRCYWTYPSVRPAVGQTLDPAEPANAPNEWHDPNYTLPTGDLTVRATDSNFYPQGNFGVAANQPVPDQPIPYYDGDVIIGAGGYQTRSDTRFQMGGITAAPIIMDDPDNTGGPQILVITGSGSAGSGAFGGRILAFDAGGRGDYDDTKVMPPLDNANPKAIASATTPVDPTQPPVHIPGTTQRLWTWPHLGIDAFHQVATNTASGVTQAYTQLDDPLRGNFTNSPAYDPDYPLNTAGDKRFRPILVPSDDGHLYAVLPLHDKYLGISSNKPQYDDTLRTYWTFPNANLGSTATLGNAPSTPAILHATSGNSYIYFSCDVPGLTGKEGRVYCIPEAFVVGPRNPNLIPYAGLQWVYPYSPNWPYADPNNSNNTAALAPGFSNSAPTPITTNFHPDPNYPNYNTGLPFDMVYTLQNDGTVLALQAEPSLPTPQYQTTVYSSGGTQASTSITSHTTNTPLISLITPIPAYGLLEGLNDPTYDLSGGSGNYVPYPALIYTDDDGNLYGLGLNRSNDGTVNPPNPPTYDPNTEQSSTILPLIYIHEDGALGDIRDAAMILSNAVLAQGDHNGQVRAYSVGPYYSPTSGTVPASEGTDRLLGGDYIDIDIRSVDFYAQTDWDKFMLTPTDAGAPGTSPGFTAQGSATRQTNPLPGLFNADPLKGVGADWGEDVYVTAWGVYHALPLLENQYRGINPPRIDVFFTVTQSGPSTVHQVTVPAMVRHAGANGLDPWLDPDDLGYTGDRNSLSIFGIDPNQETNPPSGAETTPRVLVGTQDHVYPWVAKFKLQIRPTSTNPFEPGPTGLRVVARARITQNIQAVGNPAGNPPTQSGPVHMVIKETTNMGAGQKDYNGNQTGALQNVNNRALRGRSRPLYIANPLALTTRSFNNVVDQTGQPNIIGWAGSVQNGANYNNIQELFGNGPEVGIQGFRSYKSLFAPIDMTENGHSQTYTADQNGQRVQAIYAMDRSYLAGATGNPLQVKSYVDAFQWHGNLTSVMNPLPWEDLPDDTHTTADYPGLPNRQVHLTDASNRDLVRTEQAVPLAPPILPANTPIANRIPQPTQLTLQIDVPKYMPANVNRGVVSYQDKLTGKTITFGSTYFDDAGNQRGLAGATDLMGPLRTDSGKPLGNPGDQTYTTDTSHPSGGYISHVRLHAILAGQAAPPGRRGQQTQDTIRQFEPGFSVPPTFKLSTTEDTLDFGKLPMGAGYSQVNGNNQYEFPFAPTGTSLYPNANAPSPWNDANQFGNLFRPFTLVNDSNVNMVDLRIAKAYGLPGAGIDSRTLSLNLDNGLLAGGVAVATSLQSDVVNSLMLPPLVSTPFGKPGSNAPGPGVGNIGIVSNLDHLTFGTNGLDAKTSEQPLWPIANPAVDGNANSLSTMLYNAGLLLDVWTAGSQPRPTLKKPLPGDPQGTTASVPDVPHSYTSGSISGSPNFTTFPTQLGVSIPIGTPVGTYTGKIYPYEDNVPVQWREWLTASAINGSAFVSDIANQDGIFNETAAGAPLEPVANPTFTVKVAVGPTRLTGGTTGGSLAQLDPVTLPFINSLGQAFGIYNRGLTEMVSPTQAGFNVTPAILPVATLDGNEKIFLYWATNRQPDGSPYVQALPNGDRNGNAASVPTSSAPVGLAYSWLATPYATFPLPSGGTLYRGDVLMTGPETWWSQPSLFPGYSGGQPANYQNLFPSSAPSVDAPFIPGTPVPSTVRYGSPNAAVANHVLAGGSYRLDTNESYLVWFGQIDKSTSAAGATQQITESRTFYTPLDGGNNGIGVPNGNNIQSFLNDPSVTKLGPKPLLVKFDAENRGGIGLNSAKMLYIFWYAGGQSRTSLYYNANVTDIAGSFSAAGWTVAGGMGDQKLPIPDVLTWESDPHPVLRQVTARDPFFPRDGLGQQYRTYDVIDVYYTGVLRNRQKVEVLMSRYGINRGEYSGAGYPFLKPGQLFLLDLPAVVNETLGQSGTSSTYASRDAGWDLTDPNNPVTVSITRGAKTFTVNTAPIQDKASGLLYYDLQGANNPVGGGRMVVDAQSGTVSFPNIAPQSTDRLTINYTPLVMRLSTSRDSSNVLDTNVVSAIDQPHPAVNVPGDNSQPTVVFDRGYNSRALLSNPQVVFGNNMTNDRLWVLYHKTDLSSKVQSNIYYKSMRLMIRLPYPIALTNTNGVQSYSHLVVFGAKGPYEVDWVRGRVYFTQADEGNRVSVGYTYWDGTKTGTMFGRQYLVAWGDEISVTGQYPDQSVPEVPVPTGEGVNEGQVTAFKDPVIDKLWVFWSSTRGSVPDLFYECLAPQFYAQATTQQ